MRSKAEPSSRSDEQATFGAPTLPKVRKAIDEMPEALSRIGKYIMDNPDRVVRSSLAELAVSSQSGEASVIRFCKHLGYEGFRDLKIALTAELAGERSTRQRRVSRGEMEPLATKLSDAIRETAQHVDAGLLVSLAARLRRARRIDVFGVGISGIVAELTAYRLMRVGLVAQAFQDATLAHEVLTTFDASCVAIGISDSGLTPDTVRFLSGARAAGAYALAITARENSPLGQHADSVLVAVSTDPPTIGGELTAVPAKILLAEALAGAVLAL